MYNISSAGNVSPAIAFPPVLPVRGKMPPRHSLLEPRAQLPFRADQSQSVFRITEGCIALYRLIGEGRRQIFDILGPERLISPVIMRQFQCAAVALTYTRLEESQIEPEDLQTTHDAQIQVMLQRSLSHAALLGRKRAGERVASALIDRSGQFARSRQTVRRPHATFTLYLTRNDLADWLGLTLETVSRCLNGLKRGGLIDFRSPEVITIKDQDALDLIASGMGPADDGPYSFSAARKKQGA